MVWVATGSEVAHLHYNYFRTYDPSTGRYIESDPIGLRAGLNTFGYVGASPLGFVDSLGLFRQKECFHYYLGTGRQLYRDERKTFLYSFNIPGAEVAMAPGIDPGKGGRNPKPAPDIVPTRFWVERWDVWRVDVYEVINTWEDWQSLCQSWDVDECTGKADYGTLSEGRDTYRLNEQSEEYLVNSYKEINIFKILDVP